MGLCGASFELPGGRPLKPAECRGLGGGFKSNRKAPGVPARKKEFSTFEKLRSAEDLEKIKNVSSCEEGLWRTARMRYGLETRQLRAILANKQEYVQALRKSQANRKRRKVKHQVRAPGGGRKRDFDEEIDFYDRKFSAKEKNPNPQGSPMSYRDENTDRAEMP